MRVVYLSEGEYPFFGDIDELLENFKTSGAVRTHMSFEEWELDVAGALDNQGFFVGEHDFGRFVIVCQDKVVEPPKV